MKRKEWKNEIRMAIRKTELVKERETIKYNNVK